MQGVRITKPGKMLTFGKVQLNFKESELSVY